jgi:hypothetical protein
MSRPSLLGLAHCRPRMAKIIWLDSHCKAISFEDRVQENFGHGFRGSCNTSSKYFTGPGPTATGSVSSMVLRGTTAKLGRHLPAQAWLGTRRRLAWPTQWPQYDSPGLCSHRVNTTPPPHLNTYLTSTAQESKAVPQAHFVGQGFLIFFTNGISCEPVPSAPVYKAETSTGFVSARSRTKTPMASTSILFRKGTALTADGSEAACARKR